MRQPFNHSNPAVRTAGFFHARVRAGRIHHRKNKTGLPCGGGRPLRTCRRFGLAEFCSVERSTGASDDIGWARSTRHSRVRIVSSGEVPKHSPSYRLIDSLDHLLTASATSAAAMSAHRRRDIQPAGRHPRHSARSDLLTQPADTRQTRTRSRSGRRSPPTPSRVFSGGVRERQRTKQLSQKNSVHASIGSTILDHNSHQRPRKYGRSGHVCPSDPWSHPVSEFTSILRTL